MLDLAGFRIAFGTFKSLSDAQVQAALDAAAARTDASVFGDLTNEAHGNLAADILAANPAGMNARQQPDGKKSVFKEKREELERIVGGFQIIL